jgi:hypothetical protein
MDCSSPYAMARLVGLKDRYQVASANDPDADRHGIVTPSAGVMNPNHYLAVAISYLLTHRPRSPARAAVGKTLVSSSSIDRIVNKLGRRLSEVQRPELRGEAPQQNSCSRTPLPNARGGRRRRRTSRMDKLINRAGVGLEIADELLVLPALLKRRKAKFLVELQCGDPLMLACAPDALVYIVT